MTQDQDTVDTTKPEKEPGQAALAEAADVMPPFNLPPLPKSRRAEIRVPASINGRDLSQGQP